MIHSHSDPDKGGQSNDTNHDHQHGHEDREPIVIFIDDQRLIAPAQRMTGEALRNLPHPPVLANRDLWLEVRGPGDDVLIRPEVTYEIKRGSRYYTAPSTINPGAP